MSWSHEPRTYFQNPRWAEWISQKCGFLSETGEFHPNSRNELATKTDAITARKRKGFSLSFHLGRCKPPPSTHLIAFNIYIYDHLALKLILSTKHFLFTARWMSFFLGGNWWIGDLNARLLSEAYTITYITYGPGDLSRQTCRCFQK